jgi:hypothetical protein
MFDWLIVLLGGYSKRERAAQDQILESWRSRCLAAETTVALVKEILVREQERTERLMNPTRPNTELHPPEMQPVGTSRSSWPRMRRELEKRDRMKDTAPDNAEVRSNMDAEVS